MARGRLIVIAGPSGVGKGTLVRRLLERDPDGLALSVSATTRLPRQQEVNQVDYLFVTPGEFERMESAGELLESAEVFNGARYGTPAAFVERERAAGRDVILEIDVQGARQIRVRVPDALLILLEPPSMADLERRLRGRGTEDEASIAERLRAAAAELERRDEFDATVTNDDLERAVDEVAAIIEASRTA